MDLRWISITIWNTLDGSEDNDWSYQRCMDRWMDISEIPTPVVDGWMDGSRIEDGWVDQWSIDRWWWILLLFGTSENKYRQWATERSFRSPKGNSVGCSFLSYLNVVGISRSNRSLIGLLLLLTSNRSVSLLLILLAVSQSCLLHSEAISSNLRERSYVRMYGSL